MKKSKLLKRIISFALVFIMVVTLIPANVLAATVGDIGIGIYAGDTGIDESTLNNDGTINWPIKVYDYLSDGMLFEFAQYNDSNLTSSSIGSNADGGGQYVFGNPMPYAKYGTDYTTDAAYNQYAYKTEYANGIGSRYTRQAVSATSTEPRYMKLKLTKTWTDNTGRNYPLCNFTNNYNSTGLPVSDVRYMVIVYRSKNITGGGAVQLGVQYKNSAYTYYRNNVESFGNSPDGWAKQIWDIKNVNSAITDTTRLDGVYLTINTNNTNWYMDISHIAFFSNKDEAYAYSLNAIEFDNYPGEYVSGTTWNSANNTAFGMLYATNGNEHNGNRYGGTPSTTTNGGKYAGYYTHQIGYTIPDYYTNASLYNTARKTGKDSSTGRFNGSGSEIGASDQIYFISQSYATSSAYQAKYPNATGFDMSELQFDGYNLLTTATRGVWTAGLLEGELNADGIPEYRQETVEYIADLLSKTLTIPQKGTNGYNNYSYIAGVKNADQYGSANGKALDLAQALRNCLGITFTSGQNSGSTPTMGTYATTKAKASSLKGEFLDCKSSINTCMDAAYYLLHNLFVDGSYNQTQDDFRYLTLSSAKMDNGKNAYVFDGGFSVGASHSDLENGKISQTDYKKNSISAVEYNSYHLKLGGNIGHSTVGTKDLYHFASNSVTTRFPFLPVIDADGVYKGETRSYYFAEDGKRSYNIDGGTYRGRNYNYTLVSNGEFVFNEEDGLFFEFEGDDDVYLFINNQLVLDIGGGHSISNASFQVNDYVKWAREVVANPSNYSAEELERAQALDLVDGEIAKFDFYYMERHGYGANMRIVTNMHVTDPVLRVDKTAYQFEEKVEVGGIVNPNAPIEYNFGLSNTGNTKLYNLTFDDSFIGVKLTPEDGLVINDESINGYYITDALGGTLEASDLHAEVTGYFETSENGDYIKDPTTNLFTKVEAGTGTHSHSTLTVEFEDNEALKVFLKTLEGDGLDDETVDDEHTQSGSGLWVDSYVEIKGIYYTLNDEQTEAGKFENTVYVTATTKSDPEDSGSETLKSEASHRVYVAGIPYYYQWADHNLFVAEQRILDDATAASKSTGSKLSEYGEFFAAANGNTGAIYTSFCDKYGRRVTYDDIKSYTQKGTGDWGFLINYTKPGTNEFYLLMRMQSTGNGYIDDVSTLNHGDYAIVRVMIYTTKAEDSTYVLDYGLKTEELDANGELFKNDNLLGAQSGTAAKFMGVNTTGATYLDPEDGTTDFNRIDFDKMELDDKNRIDVEGDDGSVDGFFTFNMNLPENGKIIAYNADNGNYSLSDVGTVPVHVQTPINWKRAYLYYWYDGGSDNGWPGTLMNLEKIGHFSLSIPGDVPHIIISDGNKQTINIDVNPGEEVWVNIDGTLNAEDKLVATTDYHAKDGIIHAQVPDGWGDVYLYYWDELGNTIEGGWPGQKLELDEDGFYTVNIPGNVHYVIINNGNGNGKQTIDLPVYAGKETWLTVNDNNPSYNEGTNTYYYQATSSRSTENITIHATVPESWENASIYYWNSNGSGTGVTWPGIPMIKEADGSYTADSVPSDVTNVIINDGKSEGAKQTQDLIITPGLETWIDVSDVNSNTSVEVTVPENFGDVYFYFFGPNGTIGAAWPGVKPTETNGVYTMEVPAGATKFIVNNDAGSQTQNIVLNPNAVNKYNVVRETTDEGDNYFARALTSTKLYITVPDDWGDVAVHSWNGSESTQWPGDVVTQKDENGRYVYEFTGERTSFIVNNNNNGKQTGNITEFCVGGENIVDIRSTSEYYISTPTAMPSGYVVDTKYGEDAEKLGFTFTPTDFMDSVYNLWMAITVHETTDEPTPLGQAIDANKEVQMFKKISVLPANSVYYEDDFTGVNYDTSGSANTIVHVGKGSGSLTQNVDQTTEYGSDPSYQVTNRPDYSGNSQTQVSVQDTKPFATFKFTGTGFEIIGRTNAVDDSTARIVVKDANGKVVKSVFAITEYDNAADGGDDAINQMPIVRVNGLAYGKYTVEISGVPVYDFTNMVDGKPSVKESWLIIDGIRIFQPLDSSNDAYNDTENGATFNEIRNLIADRQSFVVKYDDTDGLSVSGGTNTWIENRNGMLPSDESSSWVNNTVNSVKDYLLAGPNNEVYMTEISEDIKSAIAFYVQEDDSDVHNMQIAARAIDYGQFNAQKATGLNAELQYGAYVDGQYVWKTLCTMTTGTEQYYTIPYTECPYDEENDRYQVVIRVADTSIPGMASFSSLKYNGINLCTLNESEVPDVITGGDLSNTLIDSAGNTLDASKFVDFVELAEQMASMVLFSTGNTNSGGSSSQTVTGVDTSSLSALADTFTANSSKTFALTDESKFYIVTSSENATIPEDVKQTVQLVQKQFASDSSPDLPSMEIVWGLEKYAEDGDILIYVDSSSNYGAEEYKLEVAEKAKIYSKDVDGLLYGLNTLQKHFRKAGTTAIKGFTTQDKPDTKERIIHLDVARKYLTKNFVKNYIAEMSWMGYNALELHMSEDGGFRANVWDSNTTKLAGMSGNDFSWAIGSRKQTWAYSGGADVDAGKYLSVADLIEICEAAKEYHIEIIPSFDTPAHVDWITTTYAEQVAAGNTSIKKFTYNGTTYTLPNTINYAGGKSALNLANNSVKNLAYAMYNDIAVFFKTYAGSTKFNIGGDELGFSSSSGFTYTDFYNYINNVNSVLKSHGYRSRVYNDFFYRTNLTSSVALDSDIDVVIWTTEGSYTRAASAWVNEGRTIYGGMNYWTYYVLRYFDHPSYTSYANYGKDARDPSNTWWSFYRNTEDAIYNEWTPGLLSGYNKTEYKLTTSQLGGGYFMVWCDNATVNTEVEMWNGVWDKSTSANNGKYFYSLIERMWSNAIKQWNWDINSTLTFADYETLRDSMGYFPGYVATTSGSYANAYSLPETQQISDVAYRTNYTVTFKDYDGSVIEKQTVRLYDDAVAPQMPESIETEWYTYEFKGWDSDFTYITCDIVVNALYDETAIDHDDSGYLELKVYGGSDIMMSVDDGVTRSVGKHYYNHHMDFGKKVTVTAKTTNDNEFVAWVNATTGDILSTDITYTFYTAGNDVIIAMFNVALDGLNVVTFKNDKTEQILDIQYYTADDEIKLPVDPTFLGYEFVEWDHTVEEIQEHLENGEDVTVYPVWKTKDYYYSVKVNGGSITMNGGQNADGEYLAYKETVAVAKSAPVGSIFSHWEDENGKILSYSMDYTFYPYKDIELTAIYISDVGYVLDIIDIKEIDPDVDYAYSKLYVEMRNGWMDKENAVIAIYAWNDDKSLTGWFETRHITGDIYYLELPAEYNHMVIAVMNSQVDQSQWNYDTGIGVYNHGDQFTITPTDGKNFVIFKAEGGYDIENVYTNYFINDMGLGKVQAIEAYYTDASGIHKTTIDGGVGEKYIIHVPQNAVSVTITDGDKSYRYAYAGSVTDRAILKFVPVDGEATPDYSVVVNADIDSTTLGDRNTIFFSWNVPEKSEYTFLTAGLLLADKDDYNEETFIVGTLDPKVTHFVPAKKYLKSTGMHSVTKTGVEVGDEMVARAFVMYRDADGIVRIAYSDVVTAKK